jgi:glycosyltransferase involved in cell wall biosynthesis
LAPDLKPRVLIFQKFYEPGSRAGGPIKSIRGLVGNLGSEFDFHIVAVNYDAGRDQKPYEGIETGRWIEREGPCKVLYVSGINDPAIDRLVLKEKNWDVVYLQSFYRFDFSIKPLFWWRVGKLHAKRLIVAPRGELSLGAGSIRKTKKTLFRMLTRLIRLHRGVRFHATNQLESKEIAAAVGLPEEEIDLIVAGNLVPPFLESDSLVEPRDCDRLKMVFLSRIAPKKNLNFAIEVLANQNNPVQFDVYGMIDDSAHWELCEEAAARLPPNINFEYKGYVDPSQVNSVLSQYDVMFLPTMGENFGHVILEALLAGCQVLTSDQTPWMQLTREGVGWPLPLSDKSQFNAVIDKFFPIESCQDKRMATRRNCRKYAFSQANRVEDIERARALLLDQ